MPNCFDLSNRVAVVIGGTSGIGRAIAVGLAQQGADVVPTGRRADRIEEVCATVEALGRHTIRQVTDIRQRESVDALRDAILGRFEGVDILVNAAAYTYKKPSAELCEEHWNAILDTNLTGVLRGCQSFHSGLKASGRGRVINIASLGSYLAFFEVAPYCATKTGLLSLTRSLALEWARDGIMVNAIAPGIFPTEMTHGIVTGTPRGQELLTRTPMRRFGNPEELVGAAVLLASDGASFITGQCITVDGGFLASGVN
jgi:NAD(P)-dependent dehydrogenase (short-subunit alcohol dehydrogenase family)